MVIGIIGESCVGKSSIAEAISSKMAVEIYTGKDYLRFGKNETEAKKMFAESLEKRMDSDENACYVISETEQLELLPKECFRVYCVAPIEVIKERFSNRMHGNMPTAVAGMLERKHNCFEKIKYDVKVDTSQESVQQICERIIGLIDN